MVFVMVASTITLPLSTEAQTISSTSPCDEVAARFEPAWALLPLGMVVEPSAGLAAWLLIAQSTDFSTITSELPLPVVVSMALRVFQQFTQLSFAAYAARSPVEQFATAFCHSPIVRLFSVVATAPTMPVPEGILFVGTSM